MALFMRRARLLLRGRWPCERSVAPKNNVCLSILIGLVTWFAASTLHAEQRDDVGFTELAQILGADLPTGAGVLLAQVEAEELNGSNQPINGQYHPWPDSSNFSQITFTDVTGSLVGVSDHATSVVGNQFYGRFSSLLSNADNVSVYEALDWSDNVLNLTGRGTPDTVNLDVANFSYVQRIEQGNGQPNTSEEIEGLERFDFLVDNNNLTAVIGVSVATPYPLFSSSYNGISVATTASQGTIGTTQDYGPGRQIINVVAPYGTPSAATAYVSSAAALLHSSASQLPVVDDRDEAALSEVIKATLLAGATKDDVASWSRTTTAPLDSTYGAGELNVLNSYLIQFGGRQAGSSAAPSSSVAIDGWDYQTATAGTPLYYDFEIADGMTADELSIILTWNAEITDSNPSDTFDGTVSLANMDLRLYNSSTSFLGTLLDSSVSSVDNIEHIHQTDLGPGKYTLELTSDQARDFGLAWRVETSRDVATGDFDEDGDVDGTDFLAWQQNLGLLTGASLAQGDADGDGDVDMDDLSIFQMGTSPTLPAAAVISIPEPQSILLLTGSCLLVYLFAGHRNSRFRLY